MSLGRSNWVVILPILLFLVAPSNGKAVPEDSNIRGYEYTYNRQNGQYEVRPLYGEQSVVPSTIKPERYYDLQSGVFQTNGQLTYLPPTGKSKGEKNKMLKDYYDSQNKLNNQFKIKEVFGDYGTGFDGFVQNWTPQYLTTHDGYDNGYFEEPVISGSKNLKDKSYQKEGSCENCHVESNDEKLETYKMQPSVEYADGPKFEQSDRNSEENRFLKKKGEVKHSQNVQSIMSTDYSNKQNNEFEEVNVVNNRKHNGKYTFSEIETVSEKSGVRYYTPAIRQVSKHRKGESKGKRKKINKYKNGDFEEVKLVNSVKSIKHENKRETPKLPSTTMYTTKTPEFKATKSTPLPEKRKGYNTGKITMSEKTSPSESYEIEYIPEMKNKNSDSYTEKECKDAKSKNNAKSCPDNSDSSEPEMEPPKTVSIKTSGVKPSVVYEHDLKNKDHEISKIDSFTENECKNSKSNGNVKSCSDNSDSSEPEIKEPPKTVSIKTPGVKPTIEYEYDVNNKGYEIDKMGSFTKKEKKCKDAKSNGNVKSCSDNSDSSEPEMKEPHKTVSIKTSGVKPTIVYEYDVNNKGYETDKENSFTKKEKECKDAKSKSCSNSDSSEPEIEEPPKIVSIKTGIKPTIVHEYDVKSKGNEKNRKDFFSSIEDSSEGIYPMDTEQNQDLRREVSDECKDKFIEQINSGDMATNKLGGECRGSDVATGIIPDVHFSEVDKFRSISFLNSNLWSLIFNPNAKDHKLQKCITRKNETGNCMYIQNCPVPNIANSLEQLLNNACVMDEVFIGICCPEFPVETVRVHWEQPERNSSKIITEDEFRHDVEDCGTRSKEASKKNVWPWKAPLVSMSNGKIFCGGVIISERYILTAAHCTTKIPKNQILVRLNQDDESPGEDIPVIEIKRHAQYNPRTMQNDIALLKLDRRVSRADESSTSMICLPEESDSTDSHAGDKAILLGWQGVKGVNPQKAETLEIISNEECRQKLNTNVNHALLCTEARNEDERTCNADSGAPLVIAGDDDEEEEYEVIGILSWNRNDCDQRFPSTFSRVSSYLGWIRKHAS